MSGARAFTLIELVIVLAVMTILLLMALPSYHARAARTQVQEALRMIESAKMVETFYYSTSGGHFPEDNEAVELPKPEKFVGLYVRAVTIEDGAIHLTFGNRAHALLADKRLTVRPAIVKGEPLVPIAWICGNSKVPEGMTAIGENRTELPPNLLPLSCR